MLEYTFLPNDVNAYRQWWTLLDHDARLDEYEEVLDTKGLFPEFLKEWIWGTTAKYVINGKYRRKGSVAHGSWMGHVLCGPKTLEVPGITGIDIDGAVTALANPEAAKAALSLLHAVATRHSRLLTKDSFGGFVSFHGLNQLSPRRMSTLLLSKPFHSEFVTARADTNKVLKFCRSNAELIPKDWLPLYQAGFVPFSELNRVYLALIW